MSGLISDVILKSGIITNMSNEPGVAWFRGITIWDIVLTYLMPLSFFLALSVYLKLRYNKRRQREDITLSGFLH